MPTDGARVAPRFGPTVSLVGVSLASAGLWRAEHASYGWDGLLWLSVPRWCVPVGVGVFVAWLTWVAPARGWRRAALAASACALALVALPAFEATLRLAFVVGPGAEFVGGSALRDPRVPLAVAALATVAPFGIARAVGVRLPGWTALPSLVLVLGAGVWGGHLLPLFTDHDGFVEVVKHGVAIPFVVCGLGLPWTAAWDPSAGPAPTASARRP